MVHQWRNIKQLGHAGRGHDPAGVDATCEGELAVLCPACPQPGQNLPPDWEKEPLFIRYDIVSPLHFDAHTSLQMEICFICGDRCKF